MRNQQMGFTLVELLVVITIIVVLLALLAPAMETAIYQAELAVCETHLHGIGVAVTAYALHHKRFFPSRPGVTATGGANWQAAQLNYGGGNTIYDEQPILKGWLSLNKIFNCPLTAPVDMEKSKTAVGAGNNVAARSFVYSAYTRWYSWGYTEISPADKLSLKVGQAFTWGGDSFDLLASDWPMSFTDGSKWGAGSHPDKAGAWEPQVFQDQTLGATSTSQPYTYTFSRWAGASRGLVDFNYGYQDGSVRRITDIKRHDNSEGQRDERMTGVLDYSDGTKLVWLDLLPVN